MIAAAGLTLTESRAYLTARLAELSTRCDHGYDRDHQTCPECGTDWARFKLALIGSVRSDGLIHQCDMRAKIRGHIAPKAIGQLYRRARSEGLIADTGEREPSNDVAGRNSDKLDRVYEWLGSASEVAA